MSTPPAPSPAPAPGSSTRTVLIMVALCFALVVVAGVALVGIGGRLGLPLGGSKLPGEHEMAQIMREASGAAPIPAKDTPGRRAIRQSFQYLLRTNAEYEKQLDAHLASPEFQALMTPPSFLPAAAPRTAGRLRLIRQLDAKYVADVNRFPEVAKQQVEQAGISGLELAGFKYGLQSSGGMGDLTQPVQREMQWLDAVVALYDYAAANSQQVRVEQGELTIADDGVRDEFNRRWEQAEKLRAAAQAAGEAADAETERRRKSIGLSDKDFGR